MQQERVQVPEKSLDTFEFTVEEKIGLKNFSNIVVRASLKRDIPDDKDARQEVIDLVESILVVERGIILEDMGVEVDSK